MEYPRPNATLSILAIEPYGNEYPCELAVHWPTCDIEAEAVLSELSVLSVVGALMRRLHGKYGSLDNEIETFENPCLLVQALALELCEDVVWEMYVNHMDNVGTIPLEAWQYLQATFEQTFEYSRPFESAWSNL